MQPLQPVGEYLAGHQKKKLLLQGKEVQQLTIRQHHLLKVIAPEAICVIP